MILIAYLVGWVSGLIVGAWLGPLRKLRSSMKAPPEDADALVSRVEDQYRTWPPPAYGSAAIRVSMKEMDDQLLARGWRGEAPPLSSAKLIIRGVDGEPLE